MLPSPRDDHDTIIDRLPEHGERWGSYVLEERIASGGMADVFRARRIGAASFSRQVCLKRMHAHLGADPDMVTLFLDEALIGSKLRHRNIVAVEDLGENDGRYFLAMEYVNGPDLRRIEKRAIEAHRAMPAEAAAYIANEVLTALHVAHTALDPETHQSLNIVHRDISPQNVIVAYSGQVKLADFGVARAEGRLRQTEARSVCGKLGYMPLEQATGAPLDARADLFALGVTLFEMLTGRRPFAGDRSRASRDEILTAMVNDQRPALRALRPDVSPALASLIDAMLVVPPKRRLCSALAGLEMLEKASERTVGGRILVEWLTALYPGQASVASVARVAISIPPPLPTPRPIAPPAPRKRTDPTPRLKTASRPKLQIIEGATRSLRVQPSQNASIDAHTTRRIAPVAAITTIEPTTPRDASRAHSDSLSVAAVECAAPRVSHTPSNRGGMFVRIGGFALLAVLAFVTGLLNRPRATVRLSSAYGVTAQWGASIEQATRVRRIDTSRTPSQSPTASPASASHIAIAPTLATTALITSHSHRTDHASRPRSERRATTSRPIEPAAPLPWSAGALVAHPASTAPATGTLRVVVLTWGEVEIDGRPYGRAPLDVQLPAGSHRVRIWGGVTHAESIEIRAGQTSVIAIDEP